jgi:phage recombination protein Bet
MSTTAIAQLKQPSLAVEMASQYGMEPAKFLETIKAMVFPSGASVTNEQLAAFMIVAKQYNLNPFIREIYAFPARGGGIVPVVSVDGWTALINRQKNLDGIEFQDHVKDGKVIAITCRIFRKDREKPTEVTEYLVECFRETEPWKKWPARMLRHKALIQCARYAFSLSGIYEEDEDEPEPSGRIDVEPDSPLLQAKQEVTGKTETTPAFSGSPEKKVSQIGQESRERADTRVVFQVGSQFTEISGHTTYLKDDLPKIGAKWDADARVWRMPAARTHELLEVCRKKDIQAVEEGADKSTEGEREMLWPREERTNAEQKG